MPNPNGNIGRRGMGKASCDGWEAFRAGRPLSDNPHQKERLARGWAEGWHQALAAKNKEDAKMPMTPMVTVSMSHETAALVCLTLAPTIAGLKKVEQTLRDYENQKDDPKGFPKLYDYLFTEVDDLDDLAEFEAACMEAGTAEETGQKWRKLQEVVDALTVPV